MKMKLKLQKKDESEELFGRNGTTLRERIGLPALCVSSLKRLKRSEK